MCSSIESFKSCEKVNWNHLPMQENVFFSIKNNLTQLISYQVCVSVIILLFSLPPNKRCIFSSFLFHSFNDSRTAQLSWGFEPAVPGRIDETIWKIYILSAASIFNDISLCRLVRARVLRREPPNPTRRACFGLLKFNYLILPLFFVSF